MKQTVLIVGISSFIGSNLAESLKKEYRVVGTFHNTPVYINGVFTIPCDITKKKVVEKIVHLVKPDMTIYCVGMSSVYDCDHHPKMADALNTVGVLNVSTITERFDSLFCLISSSFVFSGDNFLFNEKDTPMSSTTYGTKMASAEFYIQKSCLNYLILRAPRVFGRSYNYRSMNWFDWLERKLYEGKPFFCDDTVHLGFIYIGYLGEVLKSILKKGVRNKLLQVSSKNYMTTFEFAKLYAQKFDLDQGLVFKGDWPFPSNNSFSEKAEYYKMHTANIEKLLATRMLKVEDQLNQYGSSFTGSIGNVKKATGIQYI